jgi:four helix bundle protein
VSYLGHAVFQFSVFSFQKDRTKTNTNNKQLTTNMQDFKKLKVWEVSHRVTLDVYRVTQNFPKQGTYGLTSQIRRASASVSANIAEGCGRASSADFARFLQIAVGSASELEYHLILARDLNYLSIEDYEQLASSTIESKRMLASLIQKVKE